MDLAKCGAWGLLYVLACFPLLSFHLCFHLCFASDCLIKDRLARLLVSRFQLLLEINPIELFLLLSYFALASLGRLAPYLERDCLRSLTPAVSKLPRTIW